jgi:hypothetical protein
MPSVSTNTSGVPFPKGPPQYKITIPNALGRNGASKLNDYVAAMLKRAVLCATHGVAFTCTARCETEQIAGDWAKFWSDGGFTVARKENQHDTVPRIVVSAEAEPLKAIVARERARAKAFGGR